MTMEPAPTERHTDDRVRRRRRADGGHRADTTVGPVFIGLVPHRRGRTLDEHRPRSHHQAAEASEQAQPQRLLDDRREVARRSATSSRRTRTPAEGGGHRTEAQPYRSEVDGAAPQVDAAPTGFMNRLATRSLETAVSGSTPKKNTSVGVMSAPPPIPVSPTTIPTARPARASAGLIQSISPELNHSTREQPFRLDRYEIPA